jgi:hypothetical protein
MAQQKIQNVSEAMSMAQEKEGDDVFLATLTQEELEESGFDVSDFTLFGKVNIYLQYWDGGFQKKGE